MTATPQKFVRKHTTSYLPLKYMRLSVQSFIHGDRTDQKPDHEFGGFIETPVPHTNHM